MIENETAKIEIVKCSEYNARAMKNPDFKNRIKGFNFSYPVMNSIDICNILMGGGSIEISMNGKAKSQWSFDLETSILKITGKGIEEFHIIQNVEELGESIMEYFEKNKEEIIKKTLEMNDKKSQSKLGNQNARRDFEEIRPTYPFP